MSNVGESLIYSWMKHVLKCRFVQTNWTASLNWELYNQNDVYNLVAEVSKALQILPNKRKSKIETLTKRTLKQFECDCVGMHIKKGRVVQVIAAEVAFHYDGLHYAPSKSSCFQDSEKYTAHKVMEKLFVAAVALYGYLDVKNARVIFATPKINCSFLRDVKAGICGLNRFWNKNAPGVKYKFELFANEDFYSQIFKQVIGMSENIASEHEVFMRSVKMGKLFDEDSDADYSEGSEDLESRENSFESAQRKNVAAAFRILKKVGQFKGLWKMEKKLYEACIVLKRSGKDTGSWLRMALREEYRRRNDLPDRPTMHSMKRTLKT